MSDMFDKRPRLGSANTEEFDVDRWDDADKLTYTAALLKQVERERDEARAQSRALAQFVREAIEAGCFSDGHAQMAAETLAGLDIEEA